MSDFEWKRYIEEALSVTDYCSIATVDEKGVKYNLYFISQMHSRHMQNLKKNNRIAVSIYKTEQKGDVLGIQLEGTAEILTGNKDEMEKAFAIYFARAGKGKDQETYMNNPTWHFVKITPQKMYYFDTRFFEEERQEVSL
ncbi:MAG: pyridoxamine 5'-phosphate oxidase family protein [Candidatus Levybacteria bacterium]|nr:pyridoxamine 5'-phosphate oxidase family protein [Candidatus Levybacteria bacterium]